MKLERHYESYSALVFSLGTAPFSPGEHLSFPFSLFTREGLAALKKGQNATRSCDDDSFRNYLEGGREGQKKSYSHLMHALGGSEK